MSRLHVWCALVKHSLKVIPIIGAVRKYPPSMVG